MELSNYEIKNKLYEGDLSIVYRAIEKLDNKPVIIKILNEEYPSKEQLISFKYEYEILKSFNSKNIIKVYNFEKIENSVAIIEEDFEGCSLNLYNWKSYSLDKILSIFIKIVESIEDIHAKNIIHKDISPSNILWNSQTDEIKIIDFGIATKLTHEKSEMINNIVLEGKLAYISPEQTGRMNRVVDYRSDFYSLGATFYEILSRKQPFIDAKDEMELIYCHLAKEPILVHEINSEIPVVISKIIQKLMAKNAENRYQSTFGLKFDLEECLNQILQKGNINDFEICKSDKQSKFQIPQKLYGRENNIKFLMKCFENACNGNTELMLISGASGIGKTALVNEIHKPIAEQRGHFISGKYDQYKKDIPYSAITSAFKKLINTILSENNEKLLIWRDNFLNALGLNGQIIIDIIPEFELIIGKQNVVPILPPPESQNRFNLVFQSFIHAIATKDHPLVIFLDDLQWSDNSSLKLIEMLICSQKEEFLFIIGSYRNNEVDKVHPLSLTVNNIENDGIVVNRIQLTSLNIDYTNKLISESLNCSTEKSQLLAELILNKTEGNPFFINELLNSLYEDKLINFNYKIFNWEWDLNNIQEKGITTNVVELMTNKIGNLNIKTQEMLKLASCIGNTFDLNKLSIISGKSKGEIASNLWEALQTNMIIPIDDSYRYSYDLEEINVKYKFAHDRIQQAAYLLILENEKIELHLKIGKLIKNHFSMEEQEHQIFDIVLHLNLAKSLILEESEKIELSYFNLIAAEKSKKSTAYSSAFNYIKNSIELLDKNQYKNEYDLCIKAYTEGAEISYLNGEFDYTEQLAEDGLKKSKTLVEKAEIYDVLVRTYIAKNNPKVAIQIALKSLNLLGVTIPENPSEKDIGQGLKKIQEILKEKSIEDLIKLPKMIDIEKLAVMKIISTVMPITYVARPTLVPMLAFSMIDVSINFGNAPASTFGYATYGLILCGTVGDIDSGYKFGELALNLLDSLGNKEFKPRTYFYVYLFISHWKQHLKNSLAPALEAYKIGIETGDIANSMLNAMLYGHHSYIAGKELSTIADEMKEYSNKMSKLKQDFAFHYNELYRYAVESWIKTGDNETEPLYEDYYKKVLPDLIESQNISAIWIIYLNKTIFNYTFERFEKAHENSIQAEKYIAGANGAITPPLFYFYDSLTNLAMYINTSELDKKAIIKKVEENQKKLETWSKYAPMNFLHKWTLVEAEKEKVLGNDIEAEKYYNEAIELVQKHEYINEEALAYELTARFYLERNKRRIAGYYLWDSLDAYQRWGAVVKVTELKRKYLDILSEFKKKQIKSNTTNRSITASTALDLESILKSSQTISNEMDIKILLEKIMLIAAENIGAQTGVFISADKENLSVLIELTQGSKCKYLGAIPIEDYSFLSRRIVNYVSRTFNDVVYYDAVSSKDNINDEYIQKNLTKSILCLGIRRNSELKGLLYFENNLSKGVFTKDRINFLKMLLGQMNISLENANLYNKLKVRNEKLENEVIKRTRELRELNDELKKNNYKLTEAYIKLEEIAKTDPLTKLLNRRSMVENLEFEIEKSTSFSVLMIDIDYFKKINDNYGHDCGDFILKSVSEKMKSIIRKEDSLARWGGEEFLILLADREKGVSSIIAEKIRSSIADSEFIFDGLSLKLTLTIGLSNYRKNDTSIDDIIKRADKALYLGKNNGKNIVVKD